MGADTNLSGFSSTFKQPEFDLPDEKEAKVQPFSQHQTDRIEEDPAESLDSQNREIKNRRAAQVLPSPSEEKHQVIQLY